MTLNVTTVGENPQTPSASATQFVPDQLIAGPLQLVTTNVTISAGTLQRGTVLGRITSSGLYILSVATATDGSQVPAAILADYSDASAGAVNAGAYLMGEFNANAVIYDPSWTLTPLTVALRNFDIFLKSSVSAADPS